MLHVKDFKLDFPMHLKQTCKKIQYVCAKLSTYFPRYARGEKLWENGKENYSLLNNDWQKDDNKTVIIKLTHWFHIITVIY